jgi:hypothetical protein
MAFRIGFRWWNSRWCCGLFGCTGQRIWASYLSTPKTSLAIGGECSGGTRLDERFFDNCRFREKHRSQHVTFCRPLGNQRRSHFASY